MLSVKTALNKVLNNQSPGTAEDVKLIDASRMVVAKDVRSNNCE